jgi:hypothetical protein
MTADPAFYNTRGEEGFRAEVRRRLDALELTVYGPPPPPPPPQGALWGMAVEGGNPDLWDFYVDLLKAQPLIARGFDPDRHAPSIEWWPIKGFFERGVDVVYSFKDDPTHVLSPEFEMSFRAFLKTNIDSGRMLHIVWQHEHENPKKQITDLEYTTGAAIVGRIVQEEKAIDNGLSFGHGFMGYSWRTVDRDPHQFMTPELLEVTDWVGIDDYISKASSGGPVDWVDHRSNSWHPWIEMYWEKPVWILEHGFSDVAGLPEWKPSQLQKVHEDCIAKGIPVRLYFNVVSDAVSEDETFLINSSDATLAKCREHVLASFPGGGE